MSELRIQAEMAVFPLSLRNCTARSVAVNGSAEFILSDFVDLVGIDALSTSS